MCSRKWLTPATSSLSSREPVRTKKPMLAEWASSLASARISRPLGSCSLRNSNGHLQRLGAERDNEQVFGGILSEEMVDAVAREAVDEAANLIQRAGAAEVVPLAGDGPAARGGGFLLHD